jgi:hypothetical protein
MSPTAMTKIATDWLIRRIRRIAWFLMGSTPISMMGKGIGFSGSRSILVKSLPMSGTNAIGWSVGCRGISRSVGQLSI